MSALIENKLIINFDNYLEWKMEKINHEDKIKFVVIGKTTTKDEEKGKIIGIFDNEDQAKKLLSEIFVLLQKNKQNKSRRFYEYNDKIIPISNISYFEKKGEQLIIKLKGSDEIIINDVSEFENLKKLW